MGNYKFCFLGTVRAKQDHSKRGLSVAVEINAGEAGAAGAILFLKQPLVVLIQARETDNVRVRILAGKYGNWPSGTPQPLCGWATVI